MSIQSDSFSSSNCTLKLPNNLEFHIPSKNMLIPAKFLIREILEKQRYYKKGFEIKSDDTIVDIGANMGLFVMWAAPQAHEGRIIAVEPTDSIEVLKTNLIKNNINNVEPIKAAIGLDNQFINIIKYPGFNVINHQQEHNPTLSTRLLVKLFSNQRKYKKTIEKISSISLGKIIDNYKLDKINLLKIDAEGCEYEILRNLSDEHFDKIDKIAMEFHEYHPGNKHQELVSILESKGYYFSLIKPFIEYYLIGKCGFIWAWRN